MGRNTTGELSDTCATIECYKWRQTPESKTILVPTLCVGGPVKTRVHVCQMNQKHQMTGKLALSLG